MLSDIQIDNLNSEQKDYGT